MDALEVRLAGNVQFNGPLTNEVVDPPDTAVVAVLVNANVFVAVVVTMPLVSVSVPDAEVAAPTVLALPPEMVRLL